MCGEQPGKAWKGLDMPKKKKKITEEDAAGGPGTTGSAATSNHQVTGSGTQPFHDPLRKGKEQGKCLFQVISRSSPKKNNQTFEPKIL